MELPILLLLWRLSDPKIAELRKVSALNCTAKPKSPAIWACLGVDPQTCPEPLIGRAKEKALNNPPCPITPHDDSSHQLTTTFLSYYNVT